MRPISGRTRSLYWKFDLKTPSLNFFFEERIVVKNAHFFRLTVGVDDVLSEPESLMLEKELSLCIIFSLEMELRCSPTPPVDILHYSKSARLQMIKTVRWHT